MSTDDLVIGIDAGTVGVRAGLFTLQGQPLGFSDQQYATLYPRPGWAEQEPAAWWDALVTAVRGCLATTQVQHSRIIGLAIDAPCNVLLVDRDGRPLMNSLIWMDLRGTDQAAQLSATSDAVLDYCGGAVPAEWPLPKALWLKQHEPALWRQATYLIEQMSWLAWRLTGVWAFPQNSAVAKWHYRVTSTPQTPAGWPVGLLQAVGLDDLLSKITGTVLPLGGQAGTLSAQAAKTLGLPSNIPVSLSGIDAYAGMVGMGVLSPGTLALIDFHLHLEDSLNRPGPSLILACGVPLKMPSSQEHGHLKPDKRVLVGRYAGSWTSLAAGFPPMQSAILLPMLPLLPLQLVQKG